MKSGSENRKPIRNGYIIGTIAFPVHGYTHATLDFDIFIKHTQRTWNALQEFGYNVSDITINDLLTKKLLIRQYALETDIHPFATGISFNQVWNNKVK